MLLALQAPVAADLRIVVGSMQNVADAERMGGLARHVAEIVRRRHPEHTLPAEVHDCFAEMGRVAVDLGNSAKDVVLSRDPERAAQISRDDEMIDELHQHLFTLLKEQEWTHGVGVRRRCCAAGPVLRTLRRPRGRDWASRDLPGDRHA